MGNSSLSIPPNVLQDKSLTPAQKLILSLFSKKQKLYSLEIAKGLGTRRSEIRDDLQQLVDSQRLFESNGNGRVSYSTVKGFEFNPGEIRVADTDINTTLTSNKKDIYMSSRHSSFFETSNYLKNTLNQSSLKVFYAFEDKVALAIQYWFDSGGVRHREHTKTFDRCINSLSKLFKGEYFCEVPDAYLYKSLLAKHKKFDLEDWMTSLDNYNLALTSPAHQPAFKEKSLALRKKISLPLYIYNPFNKFEKSFFLKYLEPPELIHAEVIKHKKFTQALIAAFSDHTFQIQPQEPEIVRAANMFGDICKQYSVKHVSLYDTAKVLPQFVKSHFEGRIFKPNWLSTDWFRVEFEYYLDRQGLINLHN